MRNPFKQKAALASLIILSCVCFIYVNASASLSDTLSVNVKGNTEALKTDTSDKNEASEKNVMPDLQGVKKVIQLIQKFAPAN